ncbi:MAG: BspA family leucine-rich repeat surface protein, partial [Clostridia bacterium]
MKKNTKVKLRLAIILIALVIVTIIGVIEYHNVTNINKIAQNKDIELKEQTVWNSETQGLGLEVTEDDITTKSITVKVVKAEIESASEQNLEYKYYIKESNKVDYEKTASYTGTQKSYTYSNLVAAKNYDVKVVLTNSNTEIESELKVINTKQVPNAQEEITKGTITSSEPTWSNGKASVTLSTTTGLNIEYQVNTATEGGWTQGTTVSNLKNGDIVRIRLSDGKNKGNAGSITIGDTAQEVSITAQETTENSITVKVASNNKEYREETRTEYSYYIKEASTANYPNTPTYTGTNSYTFNSLTSGKKYDIKVVLTNKAGNIIQGELKENETVLDPMNIYVTLYTDGTLGFSNNTETMSGKTVQTSYGNIRGKSYTSASSVPWYADRTSVLTAVFNNVVVPPSTAYWLYNCSNMTEVINTHNLDTSKVTNMYAMFYQCSSLTTLDVSNFDTSKVTNMGDMFDNCQKITSLNLSNFDTSKVTYMSSMFFACYNLTSLDLSNFNTSNVKNMSWMFYDCSSLTTLNVTNFDTSNVTNMGYMFNGCQKLTSLDVSNFDTSNVTNMRYMLNGCQNLTTLDVTNFDTSKVTDMSNMFSSCSGLTTLDVTNFDTSNVKDMSWMFYDCSSLTTLDVTNFDTSNVTTMYCMFSNCKGLTTLNVSNFDTSKVTDMSSMFSSCSGLTTLDVTNFDT